MIISTLVAVVISFLCGRYWSYRSKPKFKALPAAATPQIKRIASVYREPALLAESIESIESTESSLKKQDPPFVPNLVKTATVKFKQIIRANEREIKSLKTEISALAKRNRELHLDREILSYGHLAETINRMHRELRFDKGLCNYVDNVQHYIDKGWMRKSESGKTITISAITTKSVENNVIVRSIDETHKCLANGGTEECARCAALSVKKM